MDEMRDRRGISDQDLDRLLAGKAPSGRDGIDEALAAFAREVGTAFAGSSSAHLERSVVAAAVEASRLNIEKGDPVARPASKAHGPDPQVSGLPRWRRKTVLSSLFASLVAKIAGVAIAAAAATGGLAAAGALPAPAQQAVASAASTVGIHLPSPQASASAQASHAPSTAPTSTARGDNDPTSTARGDNDPTSTARGDNDSVTGTVASGVTHGNCVSYATGVAASLGMTGSLKGQFIAAIAQDPSAKSTEVAAGGQPGGACQAAITKAAAAATRPGQSGGSHGAPAVTATAGAGAANNPNGYGPSNHPSATDHPGPTSNPGTAGNRTGNGSTNHPGKP